MNFWPFSSRLRRHRQVAHVFLPSAGRQFVIPFRSFSIFLIGGLLLLNVYFFLRSDIFLVKNLDFEFGTLTEEALVRQKIAEQVLARSIIFLNGREVSEKIVAEFPTVKSVSLTRQFPDRLHIKVEVREALAIVQDSTGARFLVDSEGLFFRAADKEKIPVIKLPAGDVAQIGQSVSEQSVLGYLETLELVAEKGFVAQGLYLHALSIELRLKGTIVWISAEQSIEYQLNVLSQIMKRYKIAGRTPKMVDVRYARPVVSF